MNMAFQRSGRGLIPPLLQLDENLPPEFQIGTAESQQENHNRLLDYILGRLDSDQTRRLQRVKRYADIDRDISTWQRLSEEDTKRKNKSAATGEAQAIHINLPLTLTHVDDMVSFFAEVYAPNGEAFFQMPKTQNQQQARILVDKMNKDAKLNRQYKQLCMTLRRLVKYNVGGIHLEWLKESENDTKGGSNSHTSIDMYNVLWDSRIADASAVSAKAEWAAIVDLVTEQTLQEKTELGEYTGCGTILPKMSATDYDTWVTPEAKTVAKYYKRPPSEAGISLTDDKTASRIDWAAYGAGLESDSGTSIAGYERLTVYARINPYQFNIVEKNENKLILYKIVILNGTRIVQVNPVYEQGTDAEADLSTQYRNIPMFMGFLNVDDMGEATRSIAELMNPFSSYGSFLLNSTIDAKRGAIYGLTAYDPQMFDLASLPSGSTAARIPSKQPGRDVRMGLQSIKSEANTDDSMQALTSVLGLMEKIWPFQAVPSQIAGIDRAISSQVSTVMQGVNRRLHMLVKLMDDDVHGPSRFQAYVNIARAEAVNISGLTDSEVLTILGSGLAQMKRELVAGQLKELLFGIFQNQQAVAETDVIGLMNLWSSYLTIPESLEQFRRAPAQAPTPAPGASAGAPAGSPVA